MCSTFAGPCRPTAKRLHIFCCFLLCILLVGVVGAQDIGMPTAVSRVQTDTEVDTRARYGVELIDTLVAFDVCCMFSVCAIESVIVFACVHVCVCVCVCGWVNCDLRAWLVSETFEQCLVIFCRSKLRLKLPIVDY